MIQFPQQLHEAPSARMGTSYTRASLATLYTAEAWDRVAWPCDRRRDVPFLHGGGGWQ